MTPFELSPWAECWGMLGEICGCCEGPWVYRDHHNSHTIHPHSRAIGPRTQSTRSLLHSPQRGVIRTLMFLPTDASWGKVSVCKEPWHPGKTTTRCPWAHNNCTFRRSFLTVSPRMLSSSDMDKHLFFINF